MTTKVYVLPINPEPWAIGTAFALRGGRGAGISPNKKLVAFKEAAKECIEDLYTPFCFADPVVLKFYFSRKIEKLTYGSKVGHANHSDATNLQKALEDAMQGILYENDRQVVDVHSVIIEQSVDADPMIVIKISDDLDLILKVARQAMEAQVALDYAIREDQPKILDNNKW